MAARRFDNVFVLCTGRCGSTTFIKAAEHATNFTARHESRTHLTGIERLDYPAGHIEADNRLSWLLGRLDATWGTRPLYVHLTRDAEETAQSFADRSDRGIMLAYHSEILMHAAVLNKTATTIDYCRDYVATVTSNILLFLRDKPYVETVSLHTIESDVSRVWDRIGAQGNFDAALSELRVRHNARQTANLQIV